ncbi:hypothetical protein R1sor_000598 [Riccia sorocarpa]|uniref:BTB domain-containing protein n=1 Tax=Riccia sorocarpa TaxID=122646 RepID=A0ABD3GVH5_9MARC
MSFEAISLDGKVRSFIGTSLSITKVTAFNLSRKEKKLQELEAQHEDAIDNLSRKEKRLKELELAEESVKKKLHFLQSYEPGPLNPHFRGDMSFVGRDQEHIYAHRFVLEKESGTVRVDDASSHVIRSMVSFCYTADIQFTEEASAEEVLKIAHKNSPLDAE